MIRYEFDNAVVEAEVRAIDRTWFEKAKKRTRKFIDVGRFEDAAPIWSTVKAAFMRLQQNKCLFCERQFENPDYGKIEFDIEHFRPKSSVSAWPDPVRQPKIKYRFPTGEAFDPGYFWLAYDLGNYAASCKVSNTTLKLNYFPIEGDRAATNATMADLAKERPFLCYPLGDRDDNPEDLVTFMVTTAIPAKQSGHKKRRGQVIIDFFALNGREQLHRERARMISLFGNSLRALSDGTATATDRQLVEGMDAGALPHAGCIRAFKRLWEKDRATARRAYDLCREFAFSDLGTPAPEL